MMTGKLLTKCPCPVPFWGGNIQRNLLTQRMARSPACGTHGASLSLWVPPPGPSQETGGRRGGVRSRGEGGSLLQSAHPPPSTSPWILSSLLLFFIQPAQGPPFYHCVKFSCVVLGYWIPQGKAKTPEFPRS